MGKKNIVTIGGGTGTFVALTGLKKLPDTALTAVVTVSDSGGSTGRLRDAYGYLPAGDARQALVALAGDNGLSILRSLFMHRFSKGDISGHNFGNLFITALAEILGDDVAAIEAASKILQINGVVLPVSKTAPTLVAHLEDGETIVGEHEIDLPVKGRARIRELTTESPAQAYDKALTAIREADLIVLGPGDLYTSILANLVVKGMSEAIRESKGKLVYITNLFSKCGQTEDYSASEYVAEISRYAGRDPDHILVNVGDVPEDAIEHYARSYECLTEDDLGDDPRVVRANFASATLLEGDEADELPRSLVRHDATVLAETLHSLV